MADLVPLPRLFTKRTNRKKKTIMQTIVVLLVAIIGVTAYAEKPDQEIVYEMTVNGETFDITGEEQTTIHSNKEIGKTFQVMIKVKPIQHYRAEQVEFDYDHSCSVKDERSPEGRMIIMSHGSGVSMVIRENDKTSAGNDTMMQLILMKELGTRAQEKRRNVMITKPAPVAFTRARGIERTISYIDGSGDAWKRRIYLLTDKDEQFAVIVRYAVTNERLADRISSVTLHSIQARSRR